MKKGLSLFILNSPSQCYLSQDLWCVCVRACVLFIYTISISTNCISQEEFSFVASNQQIYNFYKSVIFDISELCNVIQIVAVST